MMNKHQMFCEALGFSSSLKPHFGQILSISPSVWVKFSLLHLSDVEVVILIFVHQEEHYENKQEVSGFLGGLENLENA